MTNKLINSIMTGAFFGLAFWVFCAIFLNLINLSDTLSDIYFFILPDPTVFLIILYALLTLAIIVIAKRLPETWWQIVIFIISSVISSLVVTMIWSMFDTDMGVSVIFYSSCTANILSAVCQMIILLLKRMRRHG